MSLRNGAALTLLPATTITAATTTTGQPFANLAAARYVALQSTLVYGSGGTAVKVYLQTSLDGGTTWRDIICQTFTTASGKKFSAVNVDIALAASQTASDGALADDTILSGLIGDRLRVKVVSTGTYGGSTTLTITAVVKG